MFPPCISLNGGCKLKNTTITVLPHSGLSLGSADVFPGTAVIMFTFGLTGSVMNWLLDIKAICSLFEIVMNPGW